MRDRRRIDPSTGAVREHYVTVGESAVGAAATAAAPAATAGAADAPPVGPPPAEPTVGQPPAADAPAGQPVGGDPAGSSQGMAELTADLQRVTAEYANYRKRVERDRIMVLEMATAGLLSELLPLLDDVDRARSHGDLTGPFKGVGEALETITTKLGVERFGTPGEPFDPTVHEAVMQAEPDETSVVPVCAQVLQPGYRMAGGRVLRPARVAVADPASS